MRFELLIQDSVCIQGQFGDDSKVLQPHGISMRLEVVDRIHELGVDILTLASISRLRVDDVCPQPLDRDSTSMHE